MYQLENLDKLKGIGKGSFGAVYLLEDDNPVAVKILLKTSTSSDAECEKEINALKILRHPNIVHYYGIEKRANFNAILMEYCEKESLDRVLRDPTIIYSMKTVFVWATHLFFALYRIGLEGIVHRDIKPMNVLVTRAFILKLADFGASRSLDASKTATLAGTYRYMSPEAMGFVENRVVNSLNDLYSVGLVLWEIVERRTVYKEYEEGTGPNQVFNHWALWNALQNGDKLKEIDCLQDELKTLVAGCTSYQPDQRPDIKESHDLVKKLSQEYNDETFEPKINSDQEELLRPIGFDRTKNMVPVRSPTTLELPTITMNTKTNVMAELDKNQSTEKSRDIDLNRDEAPNAILLPQTKPKTLFLWIFLVLSILVTIFLTSTWFLLKPKTSLVFIEKERWSYLAKTASWYKAFDQRMPFGEAVAYCRRSEGHLASIHSQEENDFVQKLANDLVLNGGFWIGLMIHPFKGYIWEWSDGSSVDFTNWRAGNPMSNNRAALWSDDGKWSAYSYGAHGKVEFHFICQISMLRDLDIPF